MGGAGRAGSGGVAAARLPVTEVGSSRRRPDAVGRSCWPRRGRGWTWAGRRCCGLSVAAEPGTGRWLALVQVHHLVQDHTGLEVVLGEIAALLRGEGDRLPAPLPFRDFVAQARLGVPPEEHERYFAGLLGDVTEPTAPFGLLDVHGDGQAAARGPAGGGCSSWPGGCGSGHGRWGCRPATVFHLVWARVLAAVAGP